MLILSKLNIRSTRSVQHVLNILKDNGQIKRVGGVIDTIKTLIKRAFDKSRSNTGSNCLNIHPTTSFRSAC